VRPAHPLLAAVARAHSRWGERRELYRRLARSLHDEARRALHLANAATGPDPEAAVVVAKAAANASRRGASSTAAELGDRALALTPEGDPAYAERLLDTADYRWRTGDLARSAELVGPAIEWLPPGALLARALELFARTDGVASETEHHQRLKQALGEAPPGTSLQVEIQSRLSVHQAVGKVELLAQSEALALEAFTAAGGIGDERLRSVAAAALVWVRNLRGRRVDEVAHQSRGVSGVPLYDGPDRAMAVGRFWRGEIAAARAAFQSMLALADERGESEAYFALRVQLCELELRAGRFDVVAALLEEWAREAAEPVGHQAGLLRCTALLAAGRRDTAAMDLANQAVACAEEVGIRWHVLESRRARGLAALLADDPEGACQSFREVWEYLLREDVENPGAFPVAPDFVEALARAGCFDEARAVLERLSAQAEAQHHPWARAAAALAQAQILLAEADYVGAVNCFAAAATQFEGLGLGFDCARSLLGKGAAQRRLRRRNDARSSLDESVRGFEQLGASGWAAVAQGELGRIGGRRSAGGTLTPAEQRVAELVCRGLSNKQIAAALVVSVGTVEAHLTRVYEKLQVRSRTDLVRALSGP
jgi:DNA-binding CsgD family transcriptional regulator